MYPNFKAPAEEQLYSSLSEGIKLPPPSFGFEGIGNKGLFNTAGKKPSEIYWGDPSGYVPKGTLDMTGIGATDFTKIPGSLTADKATQSAFSLDGATTPTNISGGTFDTTGKYNLEDLNHLKGVQTQQAIDAANAFDWTGAANLGMSAFNSWNQYNQQKDMMNLYKQDLSMKWKDQDRRDATRAKWSSAFQNN